MARMKNKKRTVLLTLCFLLVGCVIYLLTDYSLCKYEDYQEISRFAGMDFASLCDEKATLFESIQKYAKKIEVMPIDLWDTHPYGWNKEYESAFKGNDWQSRCAMTLSMYVPIHEFKEIACRASEKELFECLEKLDEALSREKALILYSIYFYERIHRRKPHRYRKKITSPIIPYYQVYYWKTNRSWDNLVNVIRKHKDSDDVVFPAIEVTELMIENRKNDFEKCRDEYAHFGLPDYYEEMTDGPVVQDKIILLKKTSLADAHRLKILREYFYTIYGDTISATRDYMLRDNSSSQPKTLGDIATQLLMSRLPYDDEADK